MLTLFLFLLAAVFAWLAVDAWGVRSNSSLPYSEVMKLRKLPSPPLSAEQDEELKQYDKRMVMGNMNAMFIVFVVVSFGFLAAGVLRVLE
jgi:hypothetical protein